MTLRHQLAAPLGTLSRARECRVAEAGNVVITAIMLNVTDVTNDPAWHTDILEATKTSEGPIGAGTVWAR